MFCLFLVQTLPMSTVGIHSLSPSYQDVWHSLAFCRPLRIFPCSLKMPFSFYFSTLKVSLNGMSCHSELHNCFLSSPRIRAEPPRRRSGWMSSLVHFTCAEEFPPGKEIGWNTTQFTPRSLHVILIYASSFLCYPHISKITLTQYQVQFIDVLEVWW